MIRARHTQGGRLVAELFAGPLLDSAFSRVRFVGEAVDEGWPILMLSNHFCWWDGFIQYRLNSRFFRRTLHAMMLEEELAKHPLLSRCGCFSIRKGSRSVVASLDYAARLLRCPDNMVLVFPEGEIQSLHRERWPFGSGVDYLLRHVEGDLGILLNVNLPDFGNGRKPFLVSYFRLLAGRDFGFEELVEEANRFYAACRRRQSLGI